MQTPHILIVEDELVTRNTLKSIFEAEGYDVFEATDGAEMHQILSEPLRFVCCGLLIVCCAKIIAI